MDRPHYKACRAIFEEKIEICDKYVRSSQPLPELQKDGSKQLKGVFVRQNELDSHLE